MKDVEQRLIKFMENNARLLTMDTCYKVLYHISKQLNVLKRIEHEKYGKYVKEE